MTLRRASPATTPHQRRRRHDDHHKPKVERICDHPDCTLLGEHRAPRSRELLHDYYWFCREHVREYNRAWDFYKGMSPQSIEAAVRDDATWQRPTWPLGARSAGAMYVRMATVSPEDWLSHCWDGLGHTHPHHHVSATDSLTGWSPLSPAERHAVACLKITLPTTLAALKKHYKALVKEHHPDRHNGCKKAEEKLKQINDAYRLLKAALDSEAPQKL